MKYQHQLIIDPIYGQDIMFILGDYDYYQKTVQSTMGAEPDEESKCFLGMNSVFELVPRENPNMRIYRNVIFINAAILSSLDHIALIDTIAHECLHATFETFNTIKHKPDFTNTEPINYYFDFIYRSCLEIVFKNYEFKEIENKPKVKKEKPTVPKKNKKK